MRNRFNLSVIAKLEIMKWNAAACVLWGLIVAGSLAIGFLSVFAGLAVCGARSRAFDLASLPQGRGTGPGGLFRAFAWLN
jgi:hypothetical protein